MKIIESERYAGQYMRGLSEYHIKRTVRGADTVSFSYPLSGGVRLELEDVIEAEEQHYRVKEHEIDRESGLAHVYASVNVQSLQRSLFPRGEYPVPLVLGAQGWIADNLLLPNGWRLDGASNVKSSFRVVVENPATPWDVFQQIVGALDLEYRINAKNKTIELQRRFQRITNERLALGSTAKKIIQKGASHGYFNAVRAEGADGLTVAELNGGKDVLQLDDGRPLVLHSWVDRRYTLVQSLYDAALQRLKDVALDTAYTVDVEVSRLTYKWFLGDVVKVDVDAGAADLRITEADEYPLEPYRSTLRIASRLDYETQAERDEVRVRANDTNIVLQKVASTHTRIDEVAQKLSESWRHDDGHNYEVPAANPYGLPAGYYSLDRPIDENPTRIVGISAGRLVIANEKNPDGTWKWSTFGTGDGFSASLINAGVIRGGASYWDLDHGELVLSQALKDELKGKSIERIVSEYALSTDENAPSSGWAEERPTGDGTLWRRYKFVYTDHTSTTTEPEKDSGAAIEKSKETAIQTALSIVQGELTAAQEAANIYADGVVTESEARQKKDVETRIAELQTLLMSDSETRIQEAIDYINAQMSDLQGYIWVSGNVIYIGQKGSAMAVQITNKEIRMLVNGVVMSTWDNSAMRVDKLVTKELVVADADGIEKFQFVHRQPNSVDHLTLMYMGG